MKSSDDALFTKCLQIDRRGKNCDGDDNLDTQCGIPLITSLKRCRELIVCYYV